MHNVKFGTILENAVRLCGRDVSLNAVPADWKVLAAMTVNEGLRRIASEKFPMMWRVESRRYRPDWSATAGFTAGMQCWYDGEYWQLDDASQNGEPGVAAGWTKLDMKEVPAFIAWEQPWENTVIDRGGVDVNRFAYAKSPLYYPNAAPLKCVGMTSFGIEIQAPAPKEVYVKFVPQFTPISFEEWASGTLYSAGDVVYLTSTKQCYVAMSNVTDSTKAITPGSASDAIWNEVTVNGVFEPFLTRLVAADLLTESQGKYQTAARAETEFENLCERYHEGNGENTLRRGRFC